MLALRLIAFVFASAFVAALLDVPAGQIIGVPVALGLMLALSLAVVLNLKVWAAKLAGTLVVVIGMTVTYDVMRFKLKLYLGDMNPLWIILVCTVAGTVLLTAKVVALASDVRTPATRKVAITRRTPVIAPDPDEDTDAGTASGATPVKVEEESDEERDDLGLFRGAHRGR